MTPTELPLFPLSTVLLPGGRLDLRIFERRYLDMVRDCSRGGGVFGVCLIVRGREAGEAAVPAAFGTIARIIDFSTLPDGLLGITVRGEGRFHVARNRVRDNGLIIGQVECLAADPVLPVPPEYALLATILERLAEQVGDRLGDGIAALAAGEKRDGRQAVGTAVARLGELGARPLGIEGIGAV